MTGMAVEDGGHSLAEDVTHSLLDDRHKLTYITPNVRAGSFAVIVSVDLLERNTHSCQHLAELDVSFVRRMKLDDVGIWIRVIQISYGNLVFVYKRFQESFE